MRVSDIFVGFAERTQQICRFSRFRASFLFLGFSHGGKSIFDLRANPATTEFHGPSRSGSKATTGD
jgi:hypothetical protein